MVKPDLVMRKVGRAKAWLDDAEAILSRPVGEFLTDVKSRDLATFYLFLAIQECIDLAAHWVADAGWTVPDEAGSYRGGVEALRRFLLLVSTEAA